MPKQLSCVLPVLFAFAIGLLPVACSAGQRAEKSRQGEPPAAVDTANAAAVAPVTLSYWEDESDDGDVLLDSLTAEFKAAHPSVKVERVHLSYEELLDKLKRGDAPDLVRCISDCAGPLSQSGQFRPLDDVFGGAFLERFFPGALEAATVRGRLWGIPDNFGNHLMLIYNRALVNDMPPDTEAWIAQLETLTNEEQDRYGLAYFLDEPYWLLPWIGGFGGWPLDGADNPALDTQAMRDALRFARDLKLTHKIVPPKADYDMAFDYFKQGRAAYLIDGEWSLDALQQAGLSLGVTALPRVSATGLDPTPVASGRHWFLASQLQGSKLDAARKYVEFMTSARAQERWLEKARRLPSLREVAASSNKIAADPILRGSMDQLGKSRGLPAAPEMRCVWSAMRPGLEAVMADRVAPEAASAAMQAEAQQCVITLREGTAP